MITLTKFNWQTGQNDPFPVNDKAVESFVQFMLDSRAWHDDIELVHKKVRTLRRDAQATLDNGMLEPRRIRLVDVAEDGIDRVVQTEIESRGRVCLVSRCSPEVDQGVCSECSETGHLTLTARALAA